jgi:hypothetical protein
MTEGEIEVPEEEEDEVSSYWVTFRKDKDARNLKGGTRKQS